MWAGEPAARVASVDKPARRRLQAGLVPRDSAQGAGDAWCPVLARGESGATCGFLRLLSWWILVSLQIH